MSDFWSRKKEELQREGKLPMPRPGPVKALEGPWWAEGSSLLQTRNRAPENPLQGELELPGVVDGHDVSKAAHIKAQSVCPSCGAGGPASDPKLTGLMKATPSTAAQCGSCGYVEGRKINDDGIMSGILNPSSVRTLNVKQTGDGGTNKNSTHLGATAADIAYNLAILRQSEDGKVIIGR